jgi:hypothetical protein
MTTTEVDGRTGFDFWQGRWTGRNRKLVDVWDRDCTEWIEFDGVCEAQSVLAGLGNIDTFVTEMPGRGHFEGMTIRLYEPESDTWKIWWASTYAPGQLDTPVVGRFVDGVGRFLCDEEHDGEIVKVQFEWTVNSPTSARWRQSFSYDNGETWTTNWTVDHTKVD